MENKRPLDESELKAQEKVTPRIKESEDRKPDENKRLEKLVRERTEALETELAERIKAEKSLNETNQKYAEAQRIAHVGNWEHCLLTGELHFSDEMYHILGLIPGTPLDLKAVTKCYPPEEMERFYKALKDTFEKNKPYSNDYKIIRPNGEVRYIHNEGKPVRDENGKPIRMVGTSHDITDRKLAEKSLKESEEHFQMLFNNAPVGYQSLDINGNFLDVNETWLEILGYSRNEVIGKWFGGFLAPEFANAFKERFPLFKEWGNVHSEFVMIKKNGTRILVAFDGRIGHTLTGEFKQTHCVINDITEQKRTELIQKVLYSISHAVITTKDVEELSGVIKVQLGQLLDTTNFCIAAYDEDTDMLSSQYFADQKDSFSSWPSDKSLTGYVVKHDKSLIVTKEEISEMVRKGEIHQIGSASEVWLGVPLHEDGKVIGAFVMQNYDDVNAYSAKDVELLEFISHQISISIQRKRGFQDLEKALAKAEESDHLKTAFLSNMSHEIRTPMNGILGFSELLDDDSLTSEERRTYLDIINSNGHHLLSIINDILDIARIDSNQLVIEKVPLNLHQLLDELLISYENSKIAIGKAHLTILLEKEFEDNNYTIICDEVRLRQILYNLLGNALKFTKNGFIKFGYKLIGERLQFFVQDTGKGISIGKQSLVFERFRQEEESYTRQFGGTGLGLSISKKLVELLGGEMWMISNQGVGTTFYFTIPFAQFPLKGKDNETN